MTDITHARMVEIARGLLGKYMAQGIPPDEVDMEGLREQLADAVGAEVGGVADPADVSITILRDMDQPDRVFVKVGAMRVQVGPV